MLPLLQLRDFAFNAMVDCNAASPVEASTQLQMSSGKLVFSSRFAGGEYWVLKVLSASTSCSTGGVLHPESTTGSDGNQQGC